MKFIGIGVGPGDSSLITLKAKQCLEKIDVVLAAASEKTKKSYSLEIAKDYINAKAEVIKAYFTMSEDEGKIKNAYLKYVNIIKNYINMGKNVGFLCIGDPLLYGTYARLITLLKNKYPDIQIETIPGITSFSEAASKNNRIIAKDNESLTIIPSHKINNINKVKGADNLILMKIYKGKEDIVKKLKDMGYLVDVLYVENIGLENEYITTSYEEMLRRKDNYLSLLFVKKAEI